MPAKLVCAELDACGLDSRPSVTTAPRIDAARHPEAAPALRTSRTLRTIKECSHMERPPLRYLKPTPGKTFRTLNAAEIEATVKNNLTLAAALLLACAWLLLTWSFFK